VRYRKTGKTRANSLDSDRTKKVWRIVGFVAISPLLLVGGAAGHAVFGYH